MSILHKEETKYRKYWVLDDQRRTIFLWRRRSVKKGIMFHNAYAQSQFQLKGIRVAAELATVSLTIIRKCEVKWSTQTYFSLSRTQAGFLSKQLCFLSVNGCNSFKFTRLFTLRNLSQDDCQSHTEGLARL